jgi:hypothetical protein
MTLRMWDICVHGVNQTYICVSHVFKNKNSHNSAMKPKRGTTFDHLIRTWNNCTYPFPYLELKFYWIFFFHLDGFGTCKIWLCMCFGLKFWCNIMKKCLHLNKIWLQHNKLYFFKIGELSSYVVNLCWLHSFKLQTFGKMSYLKSL